MSKQGESPAKGRSETQHTNDAQQLKLLSDLTNLSTLASHPMTWSGSATKSDPFSPAAAPYIVEFNDSDIREIELHALPGFKNLGLDGNEANRHNFDLPTVKDKLEPAAAKVHQECGVVIIRGLDPSRVSPEDNLILFLALSDFIGDVRGVQNRKGDIITHITDAPQWNTPYSKRHGIHTNGNLPFHSDMGADILALQVRQCAKEGGDTYVASAGKIVCELLARRPDIIETLTRADWPIQVSASPTRFVHVPLLQQHQDKIMINLDPGRLGLHPTIARYFGGEVVPPLTPSQLEALSVVSSIATEHRLRLDTQPGDLIFINNWALLHARSSYKDCDEGSGTRRHFVRLWLRNSTLGWDIPTSMRVQWEAAFGPDGMADKNSENGWRKSEYRGSGRYSRNYPVMPAPEYKEPKYTSGSAAFVIEDDQGSDSYD
ncbi:Clavaminate synthase-like protein [Coniochaeta ligniaria NRRL 30616]|uniref:Clavaminate synthase-like protein n=1 Tax=Coniochaeta ligniaria NRRL 30616 TaxID=1408157 RepID=A0A1J7JI43_9PEZI|nr:Clavaminate synthase-like protein [Coniochaeta ligniaria NRRL 30616]